MKTWDIATSGFELFSHKTYKFYDLTNINTFVVNSRFVTNQVDAQDSVVYFQTITYYFYIIKREVSMRYIQMDQSFIRLTCDRELLSSEIIFITTNRVKRAV